MPRQIDRDKEQRFIQAYVQTGNATQSAISIGYHSNPKTMGHYLKNKNQDEINKITYERLDTSSSIAIDVILDCMNNSKSDWVKLKAAMHILRLGGYCDKKFQEVKENDLLECSDEEIHERLIEQIKKNPELKKKVLQNID